MSGSGGSPGSHEATVIMSIVSATRPVRSSSAARKRGFIEAAKASASTAARAERTQAGSSSMKTTEWAVNAITPASRRLGCGTTVRLPSGAGK